MRQFKHEEKDNKHRLLGKNSAFFAKWCGTQLHGNMSDEFVSHSKIGVLESFKPKFEFVELKNIR